MANTLLMMRSRYVVLASVALVVFLACSQSSAQQRATQQPWNLVWSFSDSSASSASSVLMGAMKFQDPQGHQYALSQVTPFFNGSLDSFVVVETNAHGASLGLVHLHRAAVSDDWTNDNNVVMTRPGNDGVTDAQQKVVEYFLQSPVSVPVPAGHYEGVTAQQTFGAPFLIEGWVSTDATLVGAIINTAGTLAISGLTATMIDGLNAWQGKINGYQEIIVATPHGQYYVFAGTLSAQAIQEIAVQVMQRFIHA